MDPILVVDDSRVMRRIIRKTLITAGFSDCEFLEAGDGKEALERLETVEYGVQAVFCDLYMPKMDGITLLDELSNRGVLGSFPLIVLTADARKAQGEEALAHGASALVAKPFTAEEISEVMREVVPASASGGDSREERSAHDKSGNHRGVPQGNI